MTRDEVLALQQRLRDAGADAALIVLVAEVDAELRVRRRCERAVKTALFPDGVAHGHGRGAGATGTMVVPVSDDAAPAAAAPMGRKHTARKALLMAPGLAPQDKAVLAALVDRADPQSGVCWPSRTTIAADAGIGGKHPERAVLRAIHNAERSGLVSRYAAAGGRGRSTRYVVHWEALRALLAQCEARAVADMPAAQRPVRAAAGNRDNGAPQNRDNGDNAVPQTLGDNPHHRSQGSGTARGARAGPVSAAAGPRQLTMPLPIAGGRVGLPREAVPTGDRIEAAIRGKYGGDHGTMVTYLAAWWALPAADRLALGSLGAFEGWLRERGRSPPAERGARAGTQSGRPFGRSVGQDSALGKVENG